MFIIVSNYFFISTCSYVCEFVLGYSWVVLFYSFSWGFYLKYIVVYLFVMVFKGVLYVGI